MDNKHIYIYISIFLVLHTEPAFWCQKKGFGAWVYDYICINNLTMPKQAMLLKAAFEKNNMKTSGRGSSGHTACNLSYIFVHKWCSDYIRILEL